MSDKRKVSTDALETLGTIITDKEKRDAIHIAVEPVIATVKLYPGQDVGLVEGGAGISDKPVGIVDPFLKSPVFPGQRFWLLIYPRQINSLRHVWSHPDFDEEVQESISVTKAKEWISKFALENYSNYEEIVDGARCFIKYGDYLSNGGKWEGLVMYQNI